MATSRRGLRSSHEALSSFVTVTKSFTANTARTPGTAKIAAPSGWAAATPALLSDSEPFGTTFTEQLNFIAFGFGVFSPVTRTFAAAGSSAFFLPLPFFGASSGAGAGSGAASAFFLPLPFFGASSAAGAASSGGCGASGFACVGGGESAVPGIWPGCGAIGLESGGAATGFCDGPSGFVRTGSRTSSASLGAEPPVNVRTTRRAARNGSFKRPLSDGKQPSRGGAGNTVLVHSRAAPPEVIRMRAIHVLPPVLFTLVACMGGGFVEKPSDVDRYIVMNDYEGACAGLQVEDAELRAYTAEKLAEHADQQVATDCLCAALYDADGHTVDADVAKALAKTKRDDLATCLAKGVEDPQVADKPAVVGALAAIGAKSGYESLAGVAKSGDDASRAAAASGLGGSADHVALLVELATKDASADVRAAAIDALWDVKDPAMVPALTEAATKDQPSVRKAAVKLLAKQLTPEADAAVCKVMLEDSEEEVRGAAVVAWTNSRRPDAVACLKKRLLTEEPSEAIRAGTLAALKGTVEGKEVLCAVMGDYVKMYVKDALPADESLSDIVYVQNDVDFERSYECVSKALKTPGLTCYGKFHLNTWGLALGGKNRPSRCPGMPKEGGGGGGGEISFE
jgi:HEAT repeat protein